MALRTGLKVLVALALLVSPAAGSSSPAGVAASAPGRLTPRTTARSGGGGKVPEAAGYLSAARPKAPKKKTADSAARSAPTARARPARKSLGQAAISRGRRSTVQKLASEARLFELQMERERVAADRNADHSLIPHILRTRKRVRVRPNDVVVAAFPHSGGEEVAAAVAELLLVPQTPAAVAVLGGTADTGAADNSALAPYILPGGGAPVFYMLPNASTEIPEAAFAALEAIPEHVPRVFLSLQPFSHLEYLPAAKTSVLYVLRRPHEVWQSVRRQLQSHYTDRANVIATSYTGSAGSHNPVADDVDFTDAFTLGVVAMPPRMVEFGPVFGYTRHVASWTGSDKASQDAEFMAAKMRQAARYAQAQLPPRAQLNVGLVDFQAAVDQPMQLLDALTDFISAGNDGNDDSRQHFITGDNSRFDDTDNYNVSLVKTVLGADAAAALLGDADAARGGDWLADFERLPLPVQEQFNMSAATAFCPVRINGCGGSNCTARIINARPRGTTGLAGGAASTCWA